MSLLNINPTTTNAWKKLAIHHRNTKLTHLKSLFVEDAERANRFSIKWNDFLVDYSKNRIDQETIDLLLQLADEVHLKDAIQKYVGGDTINQTEGRAVLHTALRAKKSDSILIDGENIVDEVYAVKDKIKSFVLIHIRVQHDQKRSARLRCFAQ